MVPDHYTVIPQGAKCAHRCQVRFSELPCNEMFGRRRMMPAGPALLSITTGAALVPAPVYTTAKGWRCVMGPPIDVVPTGDRRADVERITQRVATVFERAIAAAPADWHLFQPGWEP